MQIDVFGLTVMIAAIAGFLMIAGGIALLWKGAITLAATPGSTAISIEYRKMLKVSTQVPGIAFFVIGTALLITAPTFASKVLLSRVELSGVTEGVDTPVTVFASKIWRLNTFSDGEIRDVLYPDTSMLTLEISATGYIPFSQPIDLTKGKSIALGSIKLIKKIDEIKADPAKIADISFKPPPVTAMNGYGGAQ